VSDIPEGFDDGITHYFELAACRTSETQMTTWVALRPDLVDASGAALAGVVSYAVDGAVGMAAGFRALPNWVVTADIDLRLVAPVRVGPIRTDSWVARSGSRQILVTCEVRDEGTGAVVGVATANHTVLPPERGAPMALPEVGVVHRMPPTPHRGTHVLDRYGIRTGVEEHSSALALSPTAKNPWGIMHGCLFGLLAEQAVPGEVADLTLRFAAPARVGPVRATARHRGGSLWDVAVVDRGADDRLCCVAFVRTR
jgi:acyl-coenzyme A thioesterase PaaI-like protein